MSNFKRFSDICAGFAAFSAAFYVFCQYMGYDFKEIDSMKEKIKLFLEPERGFSFFLPLILLFLFSCIFSLIFTKLPYLTLALSVLPLAYTLIMFADDRIKEYPLLYLVLGLIHVFGCLYECIRMDKSDRGCRAAIGIDLIALMTVLFVLFVYRTAGRLEGTEPEKMNLIQRRLFEFKDGLDLSMFKSTAIMIAVPPILRIIWRDLYYIDAAISLIPLTVTLRRFGAERFPVFGEVLVAFVSVYAIGRIAVMIFCKPKIKKKAPDAGITEAD